MRQVFDIAIGISFDEFERISAMAEKRGCSFESHKGGSGHLTVRCGGRTSQLPMHGSRRELSTKLVAKIKKDLGFIS